MTPRKCDRFLLNKDTDPHYFSGKDGSLFHASMNKFYLNEHYCVDYFYFKDKVKSSNDDIQVYLLLKSICLFFNNLFSKNKLKVETFVCFMDEDTASIKLKFRIYGVLLAISATFLGLTFLAYLLLPKLLNLHGKTLVCYIFSLFIAYSILSAVHFSTNFPENFCKCIGEKNILL